MASVFKVWAHVEEVDEEIDLYEDTQNPVCLGVFETEKEANKFVEDLSCLK